LIQLERNFALRLTVLDEHGIDVVHMFDFFQRTRGEDDTVGLEAFSVTTSQLAFGVPALID